jgi:hypothetical protein
VKEDGRREGKKEGWKERRKERRKKEGRVFHWMEGMDGYERMDIYGKGRGGTSANSAIKNR